MKYLAHFLVSLLIFAAIALAFAAIFCGINYLLSLMGFADAPTWGKFLFVTVATWILLIILGAAKVIKFISQSK